MNRITEDAIEQTTYGLEELPDGLNMHGGQHG